MFMVGGQKILISCFIHIKYTSVLHDSEKLLYAAALFVTAQVFLK